MAITCLLHAVAVDADTVASVLSSVGGLVNTLPQHVTLKSQVGT